MLMGMEFYAHKIRYDKDKRPVAIKSATSSD